MIKCGDMKTLKNNKLKFLAVRQEKINTKYYKNL